jgi:hypothetical protein
MNTFLRIVLGLGITGIGSFIVIKTRSFMDFFGYIDWAEQKLGGGGTVLVYKTLGILFCFIGFVVATDLWDEFLRATLGALLPQVGPAE